MKMGRKISGGKYKAGRKTKAYEKSGQKRIVRLGEKKTKLMRGRGGRTKLVSLSQQEINVIKNGKAKKVKIKTVVETPSNRFLARQNILVKGAIVETEIGKVRVTNRPSQEGILQGIALE
jgi:small subunit ribosomal protein S8e